jgi:hypothetical protein
MFGRASSAQSGSYRLGSSTRQIRRRLLRSRSRSGPGGSSGWNVGGGTQRSTPLPTRNRTRALSRRSMAGAVGVGSSAKSSRCVTYSSGRWPRTDGRSPTADDGELTADGSGEAADDGSVMGEIGGLLAEGSAPALDDVWVVTEGAWPVGEDAEGSEALGNPCQRALTDQARGRGTGRISRPCGECGPTPARRLSPSG